MSENNDYSSESNSVGSDSLLQSSRWWGCPTTASPVLRAGVLRPSMLGASRLGNVVSSTSTQSTKTNSGGDGGGSIMTSSVSSSGDTSVEPSSMRLSTSTKQQQREEVENDTESSETGADSHFSKAPLMGESKLTKAMVEDGGNNDENGDGVNSLFKVKKDSGAADGQSNNNIEGKDKVMGVGDDDESNESTTSKRLDPMQQLLRKNGLERSNLFSVAKNPIPYVAKSDYVFGQNVHERVENVQVDGVRSCPEANDATGGVPGELMFANVIEKAAKTGEIVDDNFTKARTDAKSLKDVAREYEERRAQKRKFEEVQTFTGEENEINVIDVNCKLFMFVNSNWEERGRGSLRLNDICNDEDQCSRVVFRTSGNLRLLINTKVWAGMVAERPSQKSMRLTAIDNGGKMKVYLVMARANEINRLHLALKDRIEKRMLTHPKELLPIVSSGGGEDDDTGDVLFEKEEEEEVETKNNNDPSGEKQPLEMREKVSSKSTIGTDDLVEEEAQNQENQLKDKDNENNESELLLESIDKKRKKSPSLSPASDEERVTDEKKKFHLSSSDSEQTFPPAQSTIHVDDK